MKQIPSQKFVSDCARASVIVDNDMPIGVFHDFLLNLKGTMVDKMVKAQKDEEAVTEAKKAQENEQSEG